MRVRAVLNPRAGLAARKARSAVEDARAPWGPIELCQTERAGHARELAREAVADGCEVVLAVGGDGTANEVAEGLLGSDAVLGLVPVGSGNGLARTLGIPRDARRALAILADAVARRMDVGLVNDRPFLNVAGAGFDAVVGEAFHAHGRDGGRRGLFTYVRLSLALAFSYEAETWSLAADQARFTGRAFVVAFSNGRQYGGGAVIAPRAFLDDGLLDVLVFEEAPRPLMVLNAARLFLGGIERLSFYRRLLAREIRVSCARPTPHHRDGEPEPAGLGLEVRVLPRALRILVPHGVAEDPGGPFLPLEGSLEPGEERPDLVAGGHGRGQ